MSTFNDSDESDEEPDDDVDEVNKGEDIFMTLLQSHLWAGLLEEQDEAGEYVATLQNLNVNNYDTGSEEEDLDYCDSMPPPFQKYDSGKYDIDDFLMLDFRTETEKKKYKEGVSTRARISCISTKSTLTDVRLTRPKSQENYTGGYG